MLIKKQQVFSKPESSVNAKRSFLIFVSNIKRNYAT